MKITFVIFFVVALSVNDSLSRGGGADQSYYPSSSLATAQELINRGSRRALEIQRSILTQQLQHPQGLSSQQLERIHRALCMIERDLYFYR